MAASLALVSVAWAQGARGPSDERAPGVHHVIAGGPARAPSSSYGASACFCGDLDGDGADEIAVGSPGDPGAPGVFVYRGRSGELLRTLWDGSGVSGFGTAFCDVGDQDGDGVHDLAVGSPTWNERGLVEIVSGRDGKGISSLEPLRSEGAFGSVLAALDDGDHDGRTDLLVGFVHAARDGEALPARGTQCARISSLKRERVWSLPLGGATARQCRRLTDLDGDGVADVVVVTDKMRALVSGKDGHVLRPLDNRERTLARADDVATWRLNAASSARGLVVSSAKLDPHGNGALLLASGPVGSSWSATVELPFGTSSAGIVALDPTGVDELTTVVCATDDAHLYFVGLPSGRVVHEVDVAGSRRPASAGSAAQTAFILGLRGGGDFDGDGAEDLLVRWGWTEAAQSDDEKVLERLRGPKREFKRLSVVSGKTGATLGEFGYEAALADASR